MPESSQKRKRPPTFQHYPKKRAKTLKKQWVQKAKIKSKWKAQKIKEGLVSQPFEPTPSDKISSHDSEKSGSDDDIPSTEDQPQSSNVLKRKQSKQAAGTSRVGTNQTSKSQADSTPTLRQLAREAYSPSTLHTFKSRPFQKGNRGARGGGGGGSSTRGTRGRGQPNMKLRMGVMLEKIKRDYT